jgi:hypothetical protein
MAKHQLPAGPGRPKGSVNRATSRVRRAIAELAEGSSHKLEEWLDVVANGDPERGLKPDPAAAADLFIRLLEFHIPRLQRVGSSLDLSGPRITSVTATGVLA